MNHGSGGGGPRPKEVVFREDMPEFITELYRERIVKEVGRAVRLKMAVFVRKPKNGGEPWLADEGEVGSVLWLGMPRRGTSEEGMTMEGRDEERCNENKDHSLESVSIEEDNEERSDREEEMQEGFNWNSITGPPPFARVKANGPQGGYSMVYNFPDLLGPDRLEQLHGELKDATHEEYLVLKSMPSTVLLQQDLWLFKGYLEPIPNPDP